MTYSRRPIATIAQRQYFDIGTGLVLPTPPIVTVFYTDGTAARQTIAKAGDTPLQVLAFEASKFGGLNLINTGDVFVSINADYLHQITAVGNKVRFLPQNLRLNFTGEDGSIIPMQLEMPSYTDAENLAARCELKLSHLKCTKAVLPLVTIDTARVYGTKAQRVKGHAYTA